MIAAMGCCEIGDEALTGITPVKVNIINKQWKDIGWYKNDKGYMQFGVIPNDSLWQP
jgi:hypothetical protein